MSSSSDSRIQLIAPVLTSSSSDSPPPPRRPNHGKTLIVPLNASRYRTPMTMNIVGTPDSRLTSFECGTTKSCATIPEDDEDELDELLSIDRTSLSVYEPTSGRFGYSAYNLCLPQPAPEFQSSSSGFSPMLPAPTYSPPSLPSESPVLKPTKINIPENLDNVGDQFEHEEPISVYEKTRISCMASAKRTSGRIVVVRDHHAHDPNSGLASSKLAKLEIKNNAMSTNLTPRELLFDAKTKFGSIPVDMAGSLDALNRMIQRTRTKNASDVNNANMIDPIFTGEMRETNEKTQFLLFDEVCVNSGGRVVGFSSDEMLKTLAESEILLADATFDVIRAPFSQLWVLHGNLTRDATVPLAFILMTKRTKDDYLYVLELLKQQAHLLTWSPKDFIGEFEEYLRTYYFGPRPNLSFPPQLWNVVESSIRHLPRTNNSVEASHRNLDKCVKMCNGRRTLYISDMIQCIRNEASGFLFDKEAIAHNPNHQVNLVRIKSEHFLKVNHRRKLQDIMKDIRIIKAITNTPIPPSLPLTGLEYLKAIRAARKYI
uniref:MULE transposase domain-containing protein n=2 Tax=Caenorhabditis japonica TaxID=281687 RepID=A0A8R1DNU4_CAEJA